MTQEGVEVVKASLDLTEKYPNKDNENLGIFFLNEPGPILHIRCKLLCTLY